MARTIESLVLIAIEAIEAEHEKDYRNIEDKLNDYVLAAGSFFDFICDSGNLESFKNWSNENIKSDSPKHLVNQYLYDYENN